MRDAEFERRLEAFRHNAYQCARFAYSELAFHHIAAGDESLAARINENAQFWLDVLAAWQSGAFMALGRIHDRTGNTDNARTLLQYAQRNPGLFGQPALRQRKQAAGLSDHDAEHYAANAHPFEPADFAALEYARAQAYAFYSDRIRPIRHQIFAHTAQRVVPGQLFAGLQVPDFEAHAVFPLQMHWTLRELYHNGRAPALPAILTATADVLAAGAPTGTNTWEHQHAAENVRAMLATL